MTTFAPSTHSPTEQALRRSRAYLAEAQRLSHTGSFGWSLSTDKHFWSDETFRIFEFDPSSTISLDMILGRVHPQDLPSVNMAIAVANTGEGIDLELRLLMPDGRIKYLHVVGRTERDESGSIEIVGAVMDVTARKLTEIELRRSKAHLADAQRLSRVGSVGLEVNTKRIFWSDEAARIYGYPPGTEPTAELILQRSHPDDVAVLKDVLERASQGGNEFDYEHRLLMPDGAIKHLRDLAHTVRDGAGNEEVVGAIMDVTERKIAEEAIRRSEAYLTEAQRLTHTGSWAASAGRPTYWSEETFRIFERPRASGLPEGKEHLDLVHPDDREEYSRVAGDAVRARRDFAVEFRIVLPNGSIKHLQNIGHPVFDAAGELAEWVGTIVDITERKNAEEERIRVRRLESERETAIANERSRLAGEIHDTLAQGLAMIVMQLADAEAKLGPAWSRAEKPLSMVRELAVESLAYARRSVNMLRPNVGTGGLARSLRDIVDSVRRHFEGPLILDVTGQAISVDATVESALAGIAREALTNAVKHSNAGRITVQLNFARAGGAVRLEVSDDGIGFDASAVRVDAYGLVSMQERAARAGVALTFVTEPGAGTTIVAGWSPEAVAGTEP
jgi:PAS domain S-box-containing protein